MSRSPQIDLLRQSIILHEIKVSIHWRKIQRGIFNQNFMITLIRRVRACRSLTILCLLLLVLKNKATFLLVPGLPNYQHALFTGVGGKTSGLLLEKCIFLSFLLRKGWFSLRSYVNCTNIWIFILLMTQQLYVVQDRRV